MKQIVATLSLVLLAVFGLTATAFAAQSSSTNYGVSEVNFGSGGELHACSTTFCAKQAAGELTVGNTASTNYQAQGGFNTDRDPYLVVSVSSAPVDLGDLESTSTKTGSTTFSVLTYPAFGYDVFIDGTSPKNNSNGHVLAPMSSATTAQTGVEQFGINLVANSSPSVGADPVQVPDSSFSHGVPSAGYGTADNFKYVAGQKIAESPKSSGETEFTLSMIANISTNTDGGIYRGRLSIIVVPTF